MALLCGLSAAQVVGTLHVYLSNKALCQTLTLVQRAGYMPIPNRHVMVHLQELGPAFYGGLFFTLSVGAGISLLSLAAAWLWDRIFLRNAGFLYFLLLLWTGFLAAVNWRGFSPMASAYLLMIPMVVFPVMSALMPRRPARPASPLPLAPIVSLFILACLWGARYDSRIFSEVRDRLLLSNPMGERITDFYYRYTMYPAEAIKSLARKTLKTCNLEQIKDESLRRMLEGTLLEHDYLHIGAGTEADLELVESERGLILKNRGALILQTGTGRFLSGPAGVLERFSLESDRYGPFRQLTLLSLLIGFPITLYFFLYTALLLLLSIFLRPNTSVLGSSVLCLAAGISLFMVISGEKPGDTGGREMSNSVAPGEEKASVEDLIRKIEESGAWYEQWRAYRELRDLGWKQKGG